MTNLMIFPLYIAPSAIGLIVFNTLLLIFYGIRALYNKSKDKKEKKRKLASLPVFNESYTGMHNGHKYVDMGLPSGTLWATCNIGAYSPNEAGYFFDWGYTTASNRPNDKKTVFNIPRLDPYHDAATTNWGGPWRIPTKAEFEELINSCLWFPANCAGKQGFMIVGPNQNSVFLPLTGYYCWGDKKPFLPDSGGYYWTCQQLEQADKVKQAYCMRFRYDGDAKIEEMWKLLLLPIRPVLPTH